MIKTAIIGYGFSARYFHIPFILHSPDFQLTSISTSKRVNLDQGFNSNLITYLSADELIQKTDAELIIITAPNNVHFSLAKACLLANKHVVLEKPMVTSVEEGQVLIALAEERGLLLTVYHNRRWDGDFLTIKELIDNKKLGQIHLFESHFDRFRPQVRDKWKEMSGEGTGVWFDLGSHLFDQAIVLFGKPNGITARCLCLRVNSEATDYFHVQLHYPNIEVILQSSPFCAHQKLRFRIEGSKGSYQKHHFDPQEADLLENLSLASKNWGKESTKNYGTICNTDETSIVPTKAGDYLAFYKCLAKTINIGDPPPVQAEEALYIIFLLHLAEKSSKQGKTLWL